MGRDTLLRGSGQSRWSEVRAGRGSWWRTERRRLSAPAYDYILANPPYVAEERKARVQKSVLEQEPAYAVFGGKDGLLYIRPFLRQAKEYLKKGGSVWMEFDSPQKAAIEKLLKQYGYKKWRFEKDQYGKWRYLSATFLTIVRKVV